MKQWKSAQETTGITSEVNMEDAEGDENWESDSTRAEDAGGDDDENWESESTLAENEPMSSTG